MNIIDDITHDNSQQYIKKVISVNVRNVSACFCVACDVKFSKQPNQRMLCQRLSQIFGDYVIEF